jgi:hypothetical protein
MKTRHILLGLDRAMQAEPAESLAAHGSAGQQPGLGDGGVRRVSKEASPSCFCGACRRYRILLGTVRNRSLRCVREEVGIDTGKDGYFER